MNFRDNPNLTFKLTEKYNLKDRDHPAAVLRSAHGCHGGAGVIYHFVVALERPLLRNTHCIGSSRGLPVPHNRRVLATARDGYGVFISDFCYFRNRR